MLVHLFANNIGSTYENVGSTVCLKNVATFFLKILQHFVINNYEWAG
jgi:hypothetical protein